MGKLLSVEPPELRFPFELKRKSSCELQLTNHTETQVAFKVLVTDQKKYWVQPVMGIVLPRSQYRINVHMKPQKELPPDMLCKDKFKIQSFVAEPGMTSEDITSKMIFYNSHPGSPPDSLSCLSMILGVDAPFYEKERHVNEHKVRVVYIPSTQQCLSGEVTTGNFSSNHSDKWTANLITSEEECKMNTDKLLKVEPSSLKFPFELKRQITCSLYLSNTTKSLVAFKVKTTDPKKYCVRPSTGIVLPMETCGLTVTMKAQDEAPANMQCKDTFMIQSVTVNPWSTSTDSIFKMFKKTRSSVEEYKLPVVLLPPPLQLLLDNDVGLIGHSLACVEGIQDLHPSEICKASQHDQVHTLQLRHQSKMKSLWRWLRRSMLSLMASWT